jgi:putative intracellular protease/amidase
MPDAATMATLRLRPEDPVLTVLRVLMAGLLAGVALQAAAASGGIEPYADRFGRARPVVAVVGANEGTELIDFMVPYGVLARSGVAEMHALAPSTGVLQFRPALAIRPEASLAQFDLRFPQGADYVIVPALANPDHPVLVAWIAAQYAKGATVVSICDGALVTARAGIMDGHRATGHWATYGERTSDYPAVTWLQNARYVGDRRIVSTAGVSAALPASLALVEAIAGTERARVIGAALGIAQWGPEHDSSRYAKTAGMYWTAARNKLFAHRDRLGLAVADGADEVALAIQADTFARTYRSVVVPVAGPGGEVRTASGLTLVLDGSAAGTAAAERMLEPLSVQPLGTAFDRVLDSLRAAYGERTAHFVADQIEYPF